MEVKMAEAQIQKIVDALSSVKGVHAVVLGGSRSRNDATESSDYDIGLYYANGELDVETLSHEFSKLDDGHKENLLNPPGAWGPWINGGGWLTVDGLPVDILLRDTSKVTKVLDDCIHGQITLDYQPGHPFGFVNTIYAAEVHYGVSLWQNHGCALDQIKSLLYSKGHYSAQMKHALISKFIWEAWFSLACGRKASLRGDLNYFMGSVFRAVCSWVQVLYALNERYVMNEKGALDKVDSFVIKVNGMPDRVKRAYKAMTHGEAVNAYSELDALHDEVVALAESSGQSDSEMRIR